LHAVANSEDQSVACSTDERLHHVRQMPLELTGKNTARRNIIAIRKTAWNTEHLISIMQCWILDQSIYVNPFGSRPGYFKRVSRFFIAIGTWGPQY
jgi:hypothetical protein